MYDYRLIRSKRKTISIHIDDHCEIVVRAPLKAYAGSTQTYGTSAKDYSGADKGAFRESEERNTAYGNALCRPDGC